MWRWLPPAERLALLVTAFLLPGCVTALPPIAKIETGPPTSDDYRGANRKPLILSQSHDDVSVEVHAFTDKESSRWFFGSSTLADSYLPIFIEIRNLRDEAIHVDPAQVTLGDGMLAVRPEVPFQIGNDLKKKILEGKRYEGHSFDPDAGVLDLEGSPAYRAVPTALAAAAWLVGGGTYVAFANARSFAAMGGTKGVVVANCFPKCLDRGERLSPDEFLSPVLLAPSGTVSGFLYFPHTASWRQVNVTIGTDSGTVTRFSLPLEEQPP